MNHLLRIWIWTIILLCFGTLAAAQNRHVLTGRVIDHESLFPVPEALVWADTATSVTCDDNGNFEISIADTLINLLVIKEGYDTLYYFIQHDNITNRLVYIYPSGFIPPSLVPVSFTFRILDSQTKQPIPYVGILDKDRNHIGLSDASGWVRLETTEDVDSIILSTISYRERTIATASLDSGRVISLDEASEELQGASISARRARYSNKNNPAVELIRKVIAAKDNNYLSDTLAGLQYEQYEKVQMGNYDMPRMLTHNFLTRRQAFIFDNIDTIKHRPHGITPIYIQEKLTDVYIKGHIRNKVTYLKALKKVRFNESFIAGKSIDNYLSHIYINFDLKDDNVMVMTNQFMSPMARFSPTFYKFYIGDTIHTEGKTLVELQFAPRNKNDFLFLGRLYINLSNYAVEYAKLGLSKDINLNFIKDIKFDIYYQQLGSGKYIMSYHNLFADFNLMNETSFGIYGEKLSTIQKVEDQVVPPDELWKNKRRFVDEDSIFAATAASWDTLRPLPLSSVEALAYKNMDSLYRQKGFNEKMKWMRFLFVGYLKVNKYWELGPTNTFYAFNPVEGLRLRFGGRTMINETKRFHIETFAGYGFRDRQWKYFASGSLGLYRDKSRLLTEYPFNYIKVTHQNDILLPGQQPGFIQEGSFFLSFKRGVNDKFIYNKYYKVEYFREFSNHIRMVPFFQWTRQMPAGSWYYIKGDDTYNDTVRATTNTEFGLTLRWAPNEKIIQGRTSRTEMNNRFPIFTFVARYALKDLWGGEYTYQNYHLNIFKRILIPQMGFINLRMGGNYIIGEDLPFTLLHLPPGNQTYWLSTQDYMLMNYMEFISDRNVFLNAEYHLYGFIFNKIPLLKKLKFREVVGIKLLYGDISDKNLPILNSNVFKFPLNKEGAYTTRPLGSDPYIETYVGVTNIMGFFRVDAIWRNTYLDRPDISKFGVRVGVFFDF